MKKIILLSGLFVALFMLCDSAHGQIVTAIDTFNGKIAADATGNVFIANGAFIAKRTPSGMVTTVAGTGTEGYTGDGGPATDATINAGDIAVDGTGNIYIPQLINNRIRKISASGIITTIAGGGWGGDGGPATAASIGAPTSIAADIAGNVYFYGAGRVRKINTSGIISTIAGNGITGYSGDGGPATAAQLDEWVSLYAGTAGNVYLCETNNSRIRKISAAGVITTIAGTGVAGYSSDSGIATATQISNPADVSMDAAGNIFFCDLLNKRIRKVTPSGFMSTILGDGVPDCTGDGGPATAARTFMPGSIAVDGANNVYFTNAGCHSLRKIAYAASGIATFAEGRSVMVLPTVNNGSFTVRLAAPGSTRAWLRVTNIHGQLVYTGAVDVHGNGDTDVPVWLGNNVPAGVYVLTVACATSSATVRFVVE